MIMQHVRSRHCRTGRNVAACGLRGRVFVSNNLETAEEVVGEYAGRTLCPVCRAIMQLQPEDTTCEK